MLTPDAHRKPAEIRNFPSPLHPILFGTTLSPELGHLAAQLEWHIGHVGIGQANHHHSLKDEIWHTI